MSSNISNRQSVRLKKKKRFSLKRKIVICGSVLFLAACAYGYHTIKPVQKEVANTVYNALAKMDDGVFIRAGNTIIYDKDNVVIGKIGNEKYKYVEISNISDYIQKGYIAKEDRNFTMHHGVDWKGTIRATVSLAKNKGKITQGGSTITQQVVKNNLLTQEKSFTRKFSEMILAQKIERDYSKADIMEYYCNSNYYGNGCYGVEGACEYYFDKSANDVDLAESAMLVAISQSPNNYNPVANYDLAMKKKKLVLDDMLECEYISKKEYNSAIKEKPEIVQKSENKKNDSYMISYAIHCAAISLMENDGFDFHYTFKNADEYKEYSDKYEDRYNSAVQSVRNGGYSIYTSLDSSIQSILQKRIDDGLSDFQNRTKNNVYDMQGAAVCVDNSTGMVVAVVGGREDNGGYNRAYQARRQPGSCIKPLLDYGPAINEGVVTPGTVLVDEPITVKGWSPKNATNTYRGKVTAREALVRSLNTTALYVFDETSQENCLKYLDRMRFSTLTYTDMISPAISIGGFSDGATVVDMAKGYATLANKGQYTADDCIMSIVDARGQEIAKETGTFSEIYTEDTAFIITDMLEGLFQDEYGAAYKKDTNRQIYAGKTGSTDNRRDAWFCGYSKHYSTAVWVGCDYPKDVGFYGSAYPMEIWISFMNKLSSKKHLAATEFEVPSTVQLMNDKGTSKNVSYRDSIHKSRPKGWDYVSILAQGKIDDYKLRQENKSVYYKAKKAVEEFEDFQINSMEEAKLLDEKYSNAYKLVAPVASADKRKALMDRITYKYDLLNGEVETKWQEVIEQYEKEKEEEKKENNALKAQKSLETAMSQLKKNRTDAVYWYIDTLNDRTVYSPTVEEIIYNSEEALKECKPYDEYDSLERDLNAAIEYARALPSEQDLQPASEDYSQGEGYSESEGYTQNEGDPYAETY